MFMSEDIIRTFKLNFDGTFDEIAYENIKEVFTIVNILAIYIQKIKKMYVWIGKNATQSLKNHISRIRVSLKEDFPQFRILRNITFDMRSEPFDFFDNLNITKDELYEQIISQEIAALPILQRIDSIKKNSKKLIKSEDFGKAITSLEEVIELARKIEDDATVIEQKRRIVDLTQKHENKKIVSKIEEETLQAEKQYNELIKTKNILRAHEVVETFIKNHETINDLLLIPAAKELISKEKKKWKSEKTKLSTDLSKLEKNFNSAIKKMDIENATKIHDRGINLISPLIDDDTRQKWEEFERILQDAKLKVEFIEKYDNLIKESIQLKEKHLYEELKQKIENIKKEFLEVDLPDYHNKLDKFQIDVKLAEGLFRTTISGIEELEKITVIDQKNKNLEEVAKDCLTLINHAKSINSFKTIERYQIILEETEKEIEARKILEEEQENLRKVLSKLEKNLITALKSMKLSKSREILEKGKKILSELVDDETKRHWNDLEKKYLETEKKKKLMEEIDNFIDKSSILKKNFQLEGLKPTIEKFILLAQEMDISSHLEKLESFNGEIDSTEELFNKINAEISELEEKTKRDQESNLLDDTLKNCEKIIELAKSIKKVDIVEKYSGILKQTVKKIEERKDFEERQSKLKEDLSKLEKNLILSLEKMEIEKISKILETGDNLLSELIDDQVKKKWNYFEKKFVDAKQLLSNIGELSKNGMEALINRSCLESQEFFEQIISQLQEYNVGE